MQITLGPALMATRGYGHPEVEQLYARARELCQQVGETPQFFPMLWGVWVFYVVRAELRTALPLAEQLLVLAQRDQDTARLMEARRALGQTLFNLGEFVPARTHLEQSLALYDRQQHRSYTFLYGQDCGVYCLASSAIILGYLGHPDQAEKRIQEALTLAQDLAHAFSLAIALNIAIRLHQLRGNQQVVQNLAETLTTLATEHGFTQYAESGTIIQGWALAMQGQVVEGIGQMRRALAASRSTGTEALRPHYLSLLAEALGKGGQHQEGLTVVADALTLVQKTENRIYESELYRLKGELLLQLSSDKAAEAESCFHQAIAIAQNQTSKSWELRAATSLARLWQSQGKSQEAHDLLAPVYEWFTEGLDTADLQEAQGLLESLRQITYD